MITRIRELLEIRQLSPTQFADLIGVGRPVISHILSERNKPSLEVVQKIIGAFPDIALPWLLAGTGPMLSATTAAVSTASSTLAVETAPVLAASPVVAAAVVPAAAPVAPPSAPAAAAPPKSYAQPPRFRPVAKPAALPNEEALMSATPAPASSIATVAVPPPTTAPDTALAPAALAPPAPTPIAPIQTAPAAQAIPVPPPALMPTAPAPSERREVANATEATPERLAPAATSSNSANPAAALSFLGEPGKAIRRIVIFYRDGSFSDYVPEGN